MSEIRKHEKGSLMYLASGLIVTGGAALFLMLMAVAHEFISAEPVMQAHAGGIYLYCAGSLLPCAAAVVLFLMIVRLIALGLAFSARTARLMRLIALMAFAECVYLAAGCTGYLLIGLMHPGVMLVTLAIVLLGGGIGLLALALSRLITRASDLQQDCDLTV